MLIHTEIQAYMVLKVTLLTPTHLSAKQAFDSKWQLKNSALYYFFMLRNNCFVSKRKATPTFDLQYIPMVKLPGQKTDKFVKLLKPIGSFL